MEFHEIANIFPLLDEVDLRSLAQSIAISGLRRPIVLFEDKILDGRNRYRACQMANKKPVFVNFTGDWDKAVRFVTDENMERRHLSGTQRVMCAARLAKVKGGRPRKPGEGQETGSIEPVTELDARTNAEVARVFDTSPASVKRGKQVLEQGVPELVAAVDRKGGVAPSAAAEVAKLPQDEQRAVVAGGKQAIKEKAAQLRAAKKVPPPVREDMSEDEKAVRRKAVTDRVFAELVTLVGEVKKVVGVLGTDQVVIEPADRELGVSVAGEFRAVADWLETLMAGPGVTDTALASWLDKGGDEA